MTSFDRNLNIWNIFKSKLVGFNRIRNDFRAHSEVICGLWLPESRIAVTKIDLYCFVEANRNNVPKAITDDLGCEF